MADLLEFLTSNHAITLGGWVLSIVVFFYAIKIIRSQYDKLLDLNDKLSTIIAGNTGAIAKLSIMLDERTRSLHDRR